MTFLWGLGLPKGSHNCCCELLRWRRACRMVQSEGLQLPHRLCLYSGDWDTAEPCMDGSLIYLYINCMYD